MKKEQSKLSPEKQLRLEAIVKPPMALFESANSVVLLLNGKMQVLKSRGKIDLENIDFIVYDEETMRDASPIFFKGKDFLIIPKKLPQKNTK